MAFPLLPVSGISSEVDSERSNILFSSSTTCYMDFGSGIFMAQSVPNLKKMRALSDPISSFREISKEIEVSLPRLMSADYYIEPSIEELVERELVDPGYSCRVLDFTVGRVGFGSVKYFGETDVRGLDIDEIVTFRRHEVVVYGDESSKPLVGRGLNKPAEVTLVLRLGSSSVEKGRMGFIVERLRKSAERQGAEFVSFDPVSGEWRFSVLHFSRFGLSDDEEEDDIVMNDAIPGQHQIEGMNGGEICNVIDEETEMDYSGNLLSHSLPTHLGLDPRKVNEMRMLMFRDEEEEEEEEEERERGGFDQTRSHQKRSLAQTNHRSSPPIARKTPLALLEYKHGSFDSNSPGAILMAQQIKTTPVKKLKTEGFKLELKHETPVNGSHSRCLVDAGLFMGRSFGLAWGPNGTLVHAGRAVSGSNSPEVLSSVICLEKVAINRVVRDENNRVRDELVESSFDSLLNLHKAIDRETREVEFDSFKLTLQKPVSNRLQLLEICRNYSDVIQKKLEVTGLSSSTRSCLLHQIMAWELIRVLFSERENGPRSKSIDVENEEDMMYDAKESASPETDLEALPLIRRAEFSYWLQENVCGRVQNDISSTNETDHLQQILLHLTGRQLDEAVELAVSNGDVRLACLLSQGGGSMANREDIENQLEIWRINGLDFNFVEKDRIRLFELLAGNIHGAMSGLDIDWKRFLGLLMWYSLPPQDSLPNIFRTYQSLLDNEKAPCPVPVYVDEGFEDEAVNWRTKDRFDISYYLMLLHGSEENQSGFLKNMFSAYSSTHDPLDHHMIWHQRAVLEAIGAISSDDLHVLDMGLVSQLLCLGKCHWAIYVALHMPYREDCPHLQAKIIREILFQYCESWSSQESQREFIENLGVPREWLHEAMAVYYNYVGNLSKALEHFLECGNWAKAHTIFVTSVAYTLFLSEKHSEIWELASSMKDHKSEIDNWDLGGGLYISFYFLRSSLVEDSDTMTELDSLESKNDACRNFISQLNNSLAVWGVRLPVDARVAYSKMAEEISSLLLSDLGEGSSRDVQLSCFDTVSSAPIPDEFRSSHLQDAVSLFTCYLSELSSVS